MDETSYAMLRNEAARHKTCLSLHAESHPLIGITGLSKSYGDQGAVTDISFAVKAGEILETARAKPRCSKLSPGSLPPMLAKSVGADERCLLGAVAKRSSISRMGSGPIKTST